MKLKIIKLDKVKSTNDVAIKYITENKISPKIIFSENQTQGRGTRGKKWISKSGNFFATIYFKNRFKKNKPEQIASLNPYIIRDVLKKYCKEEITIKWPNDLLINKKKVCGILQEVLYFNSNKFLLIGIGINTLHAPKSNKFKSTALIKSSRKHINNLLILKDIKNSYEKFISDISKYKNAYLKRNMYKI